MRLFKSCYKSIDEMTYRPHGKTLQTIKILIRILLLYEKRNLTGVLINKGIKNRHGNNEICSRVTDVAVRIRPSLPSTHPPLFLLPSSETLTKSEWRASFFIPSNLYWGFTLLTAELRYLSC
jgi:hypothetical protein